MVKILAAAILTFGLVGGAMAQSNGSGSGNGNGGTGNGASGGTNGGASGGATNSGNTNAGANNASGSDQSGALDKCKNAAGGTATTTEGATTKQEAQNCPK